MPLENPKVYFGLHICEGVAEYEEDRLFLSNDTLLKMNSFFAGKPVYVGHREVNLEKLQEEADGYVVESFFNKLDGKHWAKFIVVSDKGHEAIRNGRKLSNSYIIKDAGQGGRWHNVEYQGEVLQAEYNHLAIVDKPRYEESIILTAEQFKEYNQEKEDNLKKLNSKEKKTMSLLNIFRKNKVENSDEIANMIVTLKTSGKEMTINELMEEVDKKESEAGVEAKHRFGEEDLTLKEIEDKYNALKNEFEAYKKEVEGKKNADESEEDKKKKEQEAEDLKKKEEENKKNEEEKKKEEEEKLNAIKNAADKVINTTETIELSIHQVARGKKLYGSSK